MEKIVKTDEQLVNEWIAREFIERLGFEATPQRIIRFTQQIMMFEAAELQQIALQ